MSTKKNTDEVAAKISFVADGRHFQKGVRVAATDPFVLERPELFAPAPERPASSRVAAVSPFVADGRSFNVGDEVAVDDPIAQSRPKLFAPASWTRDELQAAAALRRSERTAPIHRAEIAERREARAAARRQEAELLVAETRAAAEAAEAELARISA
jgi:hypothetical protein